MFLLAFAIGVDVIFSDGTDARAAGSSEVERSMLARPESPRGRSATKIAYLEYRCAVPVRVRVGDGTEYAERYESVIPVRPGRQRVLLTSARGWSSTEVDVRGGMTARLACP